MLPTLCAAAIRTRNLAAEARGDRSTAQPRAMGRKVSDEWAVPLCATHHRALHTVGDEEKWWKERGIDPIAHAGRLICQMFSTGFSSGDLMGKGKRVMFLGIFRALEPCQPATPPIRAASPREPPS